MMTMPAKVRPLRTLGGVVRTLSWSGYIIGLAAVVTGVVLTLHETQHCGIAAGNSYCDPYRHPLAPLGVGVGIAGLVVAVLFVSLARVAAAVDDLRDHRQP